MKHYPIRIPAGNYSGKDPKRIFQQQSRSKLAVEVEAHLNAKMERKKSGEIEEFDYGDIAREVRADIGAVKELLYATDGGSNGITIMKP